MIVTAALTVVACGDQSLVNPNATLPPHFLKLPAIADSLCDENDAAMLNDRGLDTSIANFAMANGYFNWCVPEYDDDQRFSDGVAGSADYGSIAHVLAFPGLGSLSATNQFDGQYVQVALIAVQAPLTGNLVPYQALGLNTQNCLYLQHYSTFFGMNEGFTAVIVPPEKGLCPDKPLPSASKPLDVRTENDNRWTNSSAYPPTTRFIEGASGETLIGVKCANRWCVVGPQGFAAVPPSAHNNIPTMKGTAQQTIKGWFDDQKLGVPDAGGTFGIKRSTRASAIPDPQLGNYKVDDFIKPKNSESYKVVGMVYFPDPPPEGSKYVTRFGFGKDSNFVGLRARVDTVDGKIDTAWFAQVTPSHGVVKNDIPTRRMDHRKYLLPLVERGLLSPIPATLRWRWFDQDEDLWAECDIGCCLVGKGSS
jgi:hypothetical protein